MTQKRKLSLADADAVASEVRLLRAGYQKTGNWTLAQIAWHLEIALRLSMLPAAQASKPVDPAAVERLKMILTTGEISPNRPAPEPAIPPADAGEEAIDRLLATLNQFKTFKGPFGSHPIFGPIETKDFVRLHLIHCGHHLGHLVPS